MKKKLTYDQFRQWFFVALPVVALVAASFISVPPVIRQAFIGIALIWFQLTLMLGVFN